MSKQEGIFKCRWCGNVFDPPTELELELRQRAALEADHIGHLSRRGRW